MKIVWLVGDGDWDKFNSGGANEERLFATYLFNHPEVEKIDFIDLPFPDPSTFQYPPLYREKNGITIHLPRYKIKYGVIFREIQTDLNFKAKFQLKFLKFLLWFKYRGTADLSKLEGKSVGRITDSPFSFALCESYPSQFHRQTADYVKDLKPDIIHSMTEIFTPTAAILKQETNISNVTFSVMDWEEQLANLKPRSINHAAIESLYRISKWVGAHEEYFDEIFPISRHIKDFLIRSGYSKAKISKTFPAPVDLKVLHPVDQAKAREELDLPLNKRIILTVGRFMERKHYEDLVEILPELPPDVLLHVKACSSSSDTYRSEEQALLEQKIEENKVGNRVLIDKRILPYSDMNKVYSACDVAIFPFTGEPFGMCASEAMACETPIILYDSGNFPAFVDNNGFLIPPRDLESLKEKTLYLLENPQAAKEMGQSGREMVKEYDIEALGQRLVEIYRKLL